MERLTRFIDEANKFSEQPPKVRAAAFFPTVVGETSIYYSTGIVDVEIWKWGEEHVESKRKKKILARGDLLEKDVLRANLRSLRDDKPPGHGNIIGWPKRDEADYRERRNENALLLANSAELVMRPV